MSTPGTPPKQPDYGMDAPPVIRLLLALCAASLGTALVLQLLGIPRPANIPLRELALGMALNFLANALAMVWYSKVAKLRRRERFLDLVPWRGDETVLDVGCGRGLLLVAAARRLKTGKAIGVDLWKGADLSDNRPEATLENARLEGVADRVEVKDGDARKLPFGDAYCDVVVSGLALHNIPDRAGRQQAVREIARVLKPGGHVALVDIQHTGDYARVLRECGLADVQRSPSGWITYLITLFTWGGVQPYRVTARKPS